MCWSIAKSLIDGVEKAGYEETGLTCLSTADFSSITPLVKQLAGELRKRGVSMSVASLRAYGLNEDLLDELALTRISGLTFAPEAGTQRMRDVVNKNVTEAHIEEMRSIYNVMLEELPMLENRRVQMLDTVATQGPNPPFSDIRLHIRYQVACGTLLFLAILLNGVLRAFDPLDFELIHNTNSLCASALSLAEEANMYRPLGSGYVPMMLAAVMCFMALMNDRSSRSCSFQIPSFAEARAVT